ncbi:MAG: histidine phosphatase family protein [Alphaproteobacteria bacterium]|nr:MAG: histidine phosphatase family protein [Alphaproteobacteria bacterium]
MNIHTFGKQTVSFNLRRFNILKILFISLTTLLILPSCATYPEQELITTVYFVRHAEILPNAPDPDLSDVGKQRAQTLANILKDKGITQIHSSETVRTKATVAPLATALGLGIEIYDPYDMPTFIARLMKLDGNHLVVGHNLTTPGGVVLMGGEDTKPPLADHEYNRLYIVTTSRNGSVSTNLTYFGKPYTGEPNTPED